MDVEFVGQLIDSMDEAISKLERLIKRKKDDEANKLKAFIFDLHRQISDSLGAENV